MNKTDLKDGMRVVLRDGDEYIVAGNMIDNMESWDYLENYNEDLTSIGFSKLDIVKIYDWEEIYGEIPRREKITVWERPWMPKTGEVTYVPALLGGVEDDLYIEHTWYDKSDYNLWFERGLVFKTKDEAIEAAEKMLKTIKEE